MKLNYFIFIFPDCYTRALCCFLLLLLMLLYVECINCEFHFGLEKGTVGLISFRTITLKSHGEPGAKNCARESMTAAIVVKRI